MPRKFIRLAFVSALILLASMCAGLARASVDALDHLSGALVPSAAAALLGPVTESGRNAWDCAPERAAKGRRAGEADLPKPDGP